MLKTRGLLSILVILLTVAHVLGQAATLQAVYSLNGDLADSITAVPNYNPLVPNDPIAWTIEPGFSGSVLENLHPSSLASGGLVASVNGIPPASWTIAMDVKVYSDLTPIVSLFRLSGDADASLFLQLSDGSIGTTGQFSKPSSLESRWRSFRRIFVTFDGTQLCKYVDGVLFPPCQTNLLAKWQFGSTVQFFSDNDGQASTVHVAGLAVFKHLVTPAQIACFGRVFDANRLSLATITARLAGTCLTETYTTSQYRRCVVTTFKANKAGALTVGDCCRYADEQSNVFGSGLIEITTNVPTTERQGQSDQNLRNRNDLSVPYLGQWIIPASRTW